MSKAQPGTGTITTQNLNPTGIATPGSAVEFELGDATSLGLQLSGVATGSLSLQISLDGVNWLTQANIGFLSATGSNFLTVLNSAITGIYKAEVTSLGRVRLTALGAFTGTSTVAWLAAAGAPAFVAVSTLPVSVTITGGQAEDAPATAFTALIGGVVRSAVGPTTLIAGDIARHTMTSGAQLLVKPYGLPETDWQFAGAAGGIVNTADVVVAAAGAAGVRNYITGISAQNASATVSTEVVVKDGATTVLWRGFLGTSALLNSAVGVQFSTPLRGSAATALNVACITTGAAVYVNSQGYQAP